MPSTIPIRPSRSSIKPNKPHTMKKLLTLLLTLLAADIFANQQKFVKPLSPYEVFLANLEAGNDDQLIIRDLVESYGLVVGTKKAPGVICAVSTLEQIYQKYGYHTLNRVLRLCIGTWEGDVNSFSANMLNGLSKLISVFGDQLNDEIFKEKVGAVSVKQLVRTAKERHAGSMGFAEAMLIEYNGKKKNPAQRLSLNKLHARESSIFSGLEDTSAQDEDWNDDTENADDEF